MGLSKEQIEEFKQQIITQINSNFPEEKKAFAIQRINSMNNEEFVEFLKRNKLIFTETDESKEKETSASDKTPFRLIVEEKIPSYKIGENKEAIAVLEIKPVSKGHTIILPKEPIFDSKKIPKQISSLADRISKKIKNRLKPKNVLVSPASLLGETIINVLPVYSDESLNSERKEASPEELEELKKLLEQKPALKKEKKPGIKKIEGTKLWIPKRIP